MKGRLVAHRGYSARYPENSLRGLRAALELGCAGIEFDVQMSADGELFVHHDADLMRTVGSAASLLETPADQLRRTRLLFGRPEDTIPALDEALALLDEFPHALAFVEMKWESLLRFGHETVLAKLLPALQRHARQCVLISFDDLILQMSRQEVSLPIGWVLHRYHAAARRVAERLAPEYLIVNHRKLPGRTPLWPGPWQWMVYEINRPRRVHYLLQRGAAWVETSDVEVMIRDPVFAVSPDMAP